MRPLFTTTLYKKEYPQCVQTVPPLVAQKIKNLYDEMYHCWGNITNINRWIKKAVSAANKAERDAERIRAIQTYLQQSGYFDRKHMIQSAIKEFGWKPGFVYILTNKYMPNLIKVGKVCGKNKTVYDRIKDKDLNCTGVPCLFDVQFEIYTINSFEAEKKSHTSLNGRIGTSEFFQIKSIESAKSLIIQSVKMVDQKAYKRSISSRQLSLKI